MAKKTYQSEKDLRDKLYRAIRMLNDLLMEIEEVKE